MQKTKPIAYSKSALKSTSTHIYLVKFYFLRKIHLWGTRRKFLGNYTWGGPQAFFRQKYFCTKQIWVDVDFNADFEYAIGFVFCISYCYENWSINAHFRLFATYCHPTAKKFKFLNKKVKIWKNKIGTFVAHDLAILMRWDNCFYLFLQKTR